MNVTKKSISNPFKPIINTLVRFNIVIFIVTVVGGLTASILILNNILVLPYDTNSYKVSNGGAIKITFDEVTINKLDKLKTSNDNNVIDQSLPAGRINPFSE